METKNFLVFPQNDSLYKTTYCYSKISKQATKDKTVIRHQISNEHIIEIRSDTQFSLDKITKNISNSQLQILIYCRTAHCNRLQRPIKIPSNVVKTAN